ncbi:MAG: cytochrome C [Deltaproteobacteria bacterium CG_4_10_14_3_um_filter_60_8]|nr:MAG: cytochrome C [Desulfobacterales bacterium CG2_30_60_27]PIP44393.1 MAG: cytochrome C [Deltaproteobacteria bacterium CG23_combo_of_CG06-09_8_20_14_all_60_8]PIY21029.1 MAG: cytochrome C [Deltaproteobacteria bacterium CG_4_10_14_3_um_filter_60_8]
MYDLGKIIPGLIVFVGLVSFPIWYNGGDAGAIPKPEKPVLAKECVADIQYMRTTHMQLLMAWRDDIVREGGARTWATARGTEYNRSLQSGCMKCHTSKKKFCDTCHEYAAVTPYCWDCHIAPQETK